MDSRPIGVYDSGIGGLTVFSKLYKLLPNENFMYFGDTANIPYGTKSKEELLVITREIMNFFAEQNVKAVVMACNTTSAVAYESLKNDYDFVIYPLIQTVCREIANFNVKSVGVLSTEATASSHAYKTNILKFNPNMEVFEHGCPKKWVETVESNTQNDPKNIKIIKENLETILRKNVERIILGCTHYPYLKEHLVEIAGKDIFVDPAEYFAKYIAADMTRNDKKTDIKKFEPKFFVSADPEKFKKSSKIFYEVKTCIGVH